LSTGAISIACCGCVKRHEPMKELIDSYVTAVNCQQKAEDGVRLATIAAEAAQIEVMRAVAELARLGIPRPRLTFSHRTGRYEASILRRARRVGTVHLGGHPEGRPARKASKGQGVNR